jgi:hypothetical protein
LNVTKEEIQEALQLLAKTLAERTPSEVGQ